MDLYGFRIYKPTSNRLRIRFILPKHDPGKNSGPYSREWNPVIYYSDLVLVTMDEHEAECCVLWEDYSWNRTSAEWETLAQL